jgi:glycosyltransferase involved in cell wall biosynthesis
MIKSKSICILSCLLGMDDTHSYFYADAISSAGYPLVLICPGEIPATLAGRKITHTPLHLPDRHFEYNAKWVDLLTGLWQRWKNSQVAYRQLLNLKPEVVFCSQPDSWWVAVQAKRRLHNRVVVDLKEIYEDRASAFPSFLDGWVRKWIRSTLKQLIKSTDEIIHVSKSRQEYYDYLGRPGVVISVFPKLSATLPLRTRPENGQIRVIHAGGLRWSYASDQFLEAIPLVLSEMKDVHFVVYGSDRSELKNRNLMQQLISDEHLEIIPYLPHDELMETMPNFDIGLNLVLPIDQTHLLAQPRKLFEYLGAGVPVVASDVPTIREVVVENGCGVLVDAASPESIAKGILLLAQNEELRMKLGANGRRAAELKFNEDNERVKLLKLIESLDDLAETR